MFWYWHFIYVNHSTQRKFGGKGCIAHKNIEILYRKTGNNGIFCYQKQTNKKDVKKVDNNWNSFLEDKEDSFFEEKGFYEWLWFPN